MYVVCAYIDSGPGHGLWLCTCTYVCVCMYVCTHMYVRYELYNYKHTQTSSTWDIHTYVHIQILTLGMVYGEWLCVCVYVRTVRVKVSLLCSVGGYLWFLPLLFVYKYRISTYCGYT